MSVYMYVYVYVCTRERYTIKETFSMSTCMVQACILVYTYTNAWYTTLITYGAAIFSCNFYMAVKNYVQHKCNTMQYAYGCVRVFMSVLLSLFLSEKSQYSFDISNNYFVWHFNQRKLCIILHNLAKRMSWCVMYSWASVYILYTHNTHIYCTKKWTMNIHAWFMCRRCIHFFLYIYIFVGVDVENYTSAFNIVYWEFTFRYLCSVIHTLSLCLSLAFMFPSRIMPSPKRSTHTILQFKFDVK